MVPTRMYEAIARVDILAHCAEPGQQGSLNHPSTWNVNCQKFL
jgi:hypothetical protein